MTTWLDDYRPHGIPREVWSDGGVKAFVRDCIDKMEPLKGDPIRSRYARVLARFGAWCVQNGHPLDREEVLSPEMVDHYAFVVLRHDPSGATYRADLRRIGPRVTKRAPWQPRPTPLARRHVVPPYSESELEMLWNVVNSQSTTARRRAGRAMFLLGVGTGLDGRWIMSIRSADVQRRSGYLVVDVPQPHLRVVPVLDAYEARLVDLIDGLPETETLVGNEAMGKNATSRIVARLDIPSSAPAFSCSRLRSSWLAHHLAVGTRLPELMQAAGFEGLTVLSDLLPLVKTYPFSKYCEQLRGSE